MISAGEARAMLEHTKSHDLENELSVLHEHILKAVRNKSDNVYVNKISFEAKAKLHEYGYKIINDSRDGIGSYQIKF